MELWRDCWNGSRATDLDHGNPGSINLDIEMEKLVAAEERDKTAGSK